MEEIKELKQPVRKGEPMDTRLQAHALLLKADRDIEKALAEFRREGEDELDTYSRLMDENPHFGEVISKRDAQYRAACEIVGSGSPALTLGLPRNHLRIGAAEVRVDEDVAGVGDEELPDVGEVNCLSYHVLPSQPTRNIPRDTRKIIRSVTPQPLAIRFSSSSRSIDGL